MADKKDTYVVHNADICCNMGLRMSKVVLRQSHGVFLKKQAQIDQLFPWYTVLGNLTYAMKKAGLFRTLAERKECARSYLSMAGLSGFENAYPHQLSGGMKQRAALARALSLKPKVLLMDEPFSSLDIATKKALYPVVTAMAAQTGCTILLVTHDIREARTLGSHIAVMSRQKKGISAVFSKEAMPEAETLEKMLEENA